MVVFCINMLDSYFHFLEDSEVMKNSLLYRPFVETANQIVHLIPNMADPIAVQ